MLYECPIPPATLSAREIINIKTKVKKGTAGKRHLQLVLADIKYHLCSPVATIANYNGVFGASIIPDLIKNYPQYLSQDDVLASQYEKASLIMNKIYQDFQNNVRIFVPPPFIALLLDFLKGNATFTEKYQAEEALQKFVVVGYPESKDGKEVKPLPKALPDS